MSFDFTKATQSFDKLPFQNRLKAVGNLAKSTLSVIGKDEDIVKPWFRMLIYNFVMVSGFFYGIMGWWFELPLEGWMFFLAVVLFIYKYFYYNKQEMRMSWIVYETVIGNDPSYKGSVGASKEIQSTTRKIAWLDIAMAFIQRGKWFGGGMLMILIRLFISGLEEAWDLVNHYLLPSVAVDKLNITPAVKKMKKLKDQVPEALVGVFGIDFLGDVAKRVMIPVYIILIITSVALGILLAGYLPSSTIQGAEQPTAYWFTTLQFSWVPLIVALYLGKLFGSFLTVTVTGIKVVYFTVFYTRITHPDRIMESMQEELTDYLKLDIVDDVENLDQQPTVRSAPA